LGEGDSIPCYRLRIGGDIDMGTPLMDKKYKAEKRKQPDGTFILVRMGKVKESKYTRHQGKKEMERRKKA
jgi:hypothetical protein